MRNHSISKVLFVSTFPPRKCGIASFTQDLVNAIKPEIDDEFSVHICALDKKVNGLKYEHPVMMVMDGSNRASCLEVASRINLDPSVKLVCIEHEFGLFGGELGNYVLDFLLLLEKPFIIRFHTVLPDPDAERLKMVRTICQLAEKVIVMTKTSAQLLEEDYQQHGNKIIVIPHGTHENSRVSAHELKIKYNLENKHVLISFGLLSPNKGIEKGILAMKEISVRFPQAMYIVLGQTHPNLLEREGEAYRDYLRKLISDNHLENNVRLVNEYIPTGKLMEYLKLADLYLFTSKDPNQAVSGTFLYAMSAGCPVISNSFVLAKEMLDKETGIILETFHTSELAASAILLLENDPLRARMRNNALLKMRDTTWAKVGKYHSDLFHEIFVGTALSGELSNQIVKA